MTLRAPHFDARDIVIEGVPGSWAVFSSDRAYRYLLARTWDDFHAPVLISPLMVFVMLNPSTADAFAPDPTITRCIGFAKRERCGGILVANLFAWRSTDPRALTRVSDPVGHHNEAMIRRALTLLPAVRIAAWGAIKTRQLQALGNRTALVARTYGARWCLGKTKGGEPRHPLMLRADTPIVSLVNGRSLP